MRISDWSSDVCSSDLTDTDLLTDVGSGVPGSDASIIPPPFIFGTVLSSDGTDKTKRSMISAAYTHDAPIVIADNVDVKVFYTKLDRNEHTDQILTDTIDNFHRVSDLKFLQEIWGADVQFGLTRPRSDGRRVGKEG